MWRGKGSSSTHSSSGTHRGEEVSTNPDQNVTGRPSALLPAFLPRRQGLNVTTRWPSLGARSTPCGSGPYPSPATRRVWRESATVTRCPALTSNGNLLPPYSRTVLAGVCAAPTRTSGPTTTLCGSEYAPGKSAIELVEQFSTAPFGRSLSRSGGGVRSLASSPRASSVGATASATAMPINAATFRPFIRQLHTGRSFSSKALQLPSRNAPRGLRQPARHAEALHAVLAAARQTGAEQLWSNRDRIGRAGRILRSRSLTREKCARLVGRRRLRGQRIGRSAALRADGLAGSAGSLERMLHHAVLEIAGCRSAAMREGRELLC